jgi:hypothetical protein
MRASKASSRRDSEAGDTQSFFSGEFPIITNERSRAWGARSDAKCPQAAKVLVQGSLIYEVYADHTEFIALGDG